MGDSGNISGVKSIQKHMEILQNKINNRLGWYYMFQLLNIYGCQIFLPFIRPKKRPKLYLMKQSNILLEKESLSSRELAENLELKGLSGSLKKAIKHLLELRLIEYTIPDKPKSKNQKYKRKVIG